MTRDGTGSRGRLVGRPALLGLLCVASWLAFAPAARAEPADAGTDGGVEVVDGGVPDASVPVVEPEPPPVIAEISLPPSSIDPPLAPEEPSPPTAGELITVILGLVVIVALAYLGGHPRVRELEEKLRISHVVTAGFPFVILGLVARHPTVGILSDAVLDEIRPILPFGLGWIGLALGFRFDTRELDRPPPHLGLALGLLTVTPFVLTLAACGLLLWFSRGSHPEFMRHALILAIASIISGSSTPVLARPVVDETGLNRLTRIVQLEQLAAVAGLALVAAFFRPTGGLVGWRLPGMAWLFVTLGLSGMLGVAAYAILAVVRSRTEVTLVMVGAICFSAGMASFLRLSPTVVCFAAGLVLANVPGSHKAQVRDTLDRLEGPIYLVFLFLAGAHWRLGDFEGWALLVAFVVARAAGKQLGVTILKRRTDGALSGEERRALALSPMGALAIATAISAQDLYIGAESSWVVTAVIGGAIVNEILVQALGRGPAARAAAGVG
jgi:Kef-type K+ transport system membrane component KefB